MILYKIKELIARQSLLADKLRKINCMLKGVHCVVHTKCGKPNCWCVNEKGHRHERISWREANRSCIRAIPNDDIQWVKEMTKNYHSFKKLQTTLVNTQKELNSTIEKLRDEIIGRTKRGKAYLKIKK